MNIHEKKGFIFVWGLIIMVLLSTHSISFG